MEKKCIVFDFDGTLADVEEVIVDIYRDFASKNGWPELDKKIYKELKVGGAKMAIKMLGIRFWQLPKLLRRGISEYKKHAHDIKLFPGIAEVVEKLGNEYDVYILSSNDASVVKEIIKHNNLKANITILKGSPLFGKDKPLKKLLKEHGYSSQQAWMIGDEARDIEAGTKAGMKTIAVSWGLQSDKGLAQANPDYTASKPADILKIIV